MIFSPKAWPLRCYFWLLSLFPRLLGKSQLNVYFANFSWHNAEEQIRNVLRRRFLCKTKLNVMQRPCVINPSLDEAVFKGGGKGWWSISAQSCEQQLFRVLSSWSSGAAADGPTSALQALTSAVRSFELYFVHRLFFCVCVDILKSFFERQMQTYFGGRIQLKRVQARVQLRLYQKVNLRM